MKVRQELFGFNAELGCVLSIGNFDGVHLGHQSMINTLSELKIRHHLPSVLLTFEPHPLEMLKPQSAPPRLTRFREKMSILHHLSGAPDEVICLRFNRALSQMSAPEFIQRVLLDGFGVRHLLVGEDFHFGRGGQGNVDLLRDASLEHGFNFDCFATVERDGGRISSTRVRDALKSGDLKTVGDLLGRPYSLCGRVSRGQQLGRQLGFPTANISLKRNQSPLSGVFAVALTRESGQQLNGVANVGRRPTVNGLEERVEVYVLNFDENLYGEELKVEFLTRIRAEKRFNGLEELTQQIGLDVQSAKEYFKDQAQR